MREVICPHCQTHNRMSKTIVCGHCKNDLILYADNDANHNKSSWVEIAVYTAVISLSSVFVYEKAVEDMIFAPRYRLIDEYNLMNACISNTNHFQQTNQVCTCAIEETQKEIPHSSSVSKQDFNNVFREKINYCKANKTR